MAPNLVSMTQMEFVPVVAAVVRRGDRYLVCQRPRSKSYGTRWEFPGGKCRVGESFHDALKRELFEELRLVVRESEGAICSFEDREAGIKIGFHPVKTSGQPELLEHTDLAWLPLNELRDLDLAPTDRLFVDQCLESNPNVPRGKEI